MITDASGREQEPMPGLADMARSFPMAIIKWARAGFPVVEETQMQSRLDTCRSCRHWKPDGAAGQCKRCGCGVMKLWLATERCPINKWLAVKPAVS